ncbi:hypothetical protein QCA50_003615 [Cerrena zonata]|uniref:Pre-mRNA-processing protein 45 n=1 Tax=Cerrena zonata TaxID=2478898 RepID=A0AAW0GSN8_9APHY
MAALASLLPKPVHVSISDDEDDIVRVSQQVAESSLQSKSVVIRLAVPSYGQRNGWKPSSQEDFGLGKKKTAAGNTLALQVDSEGNVRYDAIAQQGQRAGKIIQSQFKDLVPLAHRKDLDDDARLMERPSEDEVQTTTDKTRAALEKLVNGKIKAAQPKNVPDGHGKTSFIRYTPGQQNGSGWVEAEDHQDDRSGRGSFGAPSVQA